MKRRGKKGPENFNRRQPQTGRTRRSELAWVLREVGRLRGAPVQTVPAALEALEALATPREKLIRALGPSNEGEWGAVAGVVEYVLQILAEWACSESKDLRDDRAVHDLYTLLRKGYVAR
jgi:hypothetical protein